MRSGVRKAIQIAGGSQKQFDGWMNSGEFTLQQIRDAHALRGELMRKRSFGRRMANDDYAPCASQHPIPMPTLEDKIERGRRSRTARERGAQIRCGDGSVAAGSQAMKEPRIRKALDAERSTRLHAASRLYG